jgi:hypothetical protein
MTAILRKRIPALAYLLTLVVGLLGFVSAHAEAFQGAGTPILGLIQPHTPSAETDDVDDPFMEKSFSVDGAGLLRVFTPSGDIRVVGVKDTNAVVVRLYVRRGYALWSGSKSLENFRITQMQRGNEITASVEPKNRDSKMWGNSEVSFYFEIRAPQEFSTEMQSLGGNIRIDNMRGRHLIKTNGGSLRLNKVQGEIKGFTAGGHIQLAECRGNVMAKTYGGNIQMRNVQGEVRTYSSGGNIDAQAMEGTFFARTNGGNIQADMQYVDQGLRLESSAGNVEARVPSNEGYEVVLKGMSVNFDRGSNFLGQHSNRLVSGQIGDGGPTINMNANVGTVSLILSGSATRTRHHQDTTEDTNFNLEFDW